MTLVVGVVASVCAVGVVAWFMLGERHPENAAGHGTASTETTSERLYRGSDRPAGPDAEPMDPDTLGGDHRPPR